jgi:hypothetical protein
MLEPVWTYVFADWESRTLPVFHARSAALAAVSTRQVVNMIAMVSFIFTFQRAHRYLTAAAIPPIRIHSSTNRVTSIWIAFAGGRNKKWYPAGVSER